MHICCLSWACAACSGTSGADFALYSQNLFTFIFTLTIQISSRANVSDCTSTSSWSILKCAQQLRSCIEQIVPESAFAPCQASYKENRSTVLFSAYI